MKRTFLIIALVIGLALGLSVAVGVAWYFVREPSAGPTAIRDGKLSLSEFNGARKPAEAAKWFERRDVNHDGFISHEEFLPFSAGPKAQ